MKKPHRRVGKARPGVRKLRVGVVFGGRSVEHEVSIVSAAGVIAALDRRKYDVIPIGITPKGEWIVHRDAVEMFRRGARGLAGHRYAISTTPGTPGSSGSGGVLTPMDGRRGAPVKVDIFLPLLHGSFGEDGKLQGLFEMAGVPYAGAGVAGSAVGMDKVLAKRVWMSAGLPVVPFVVFRGEWFKRDRRTILADLSRRVGVPCFVKPANSGSSIGITKVTDRKRLAAAIEAALRYDRSVLVEKAVPGAREFEVGVIGNETPRTTIPGEVIPSNEFYDYDAKYVDGKSETVIPARIPRAAAKKIREVAALAYAAANCEGMARVDFLADRACRRIYLSEINTIPGFTPISMFPKLWEASGLSYPGLLDALIRLGLERHRAVSRLNLLYKPRRDWHRDSG